MRVISNLFASFANSIPSRKNTKQLINSLQNLNPKDIKTDILKDIKIDVYDTILSIFDSKENIRRLSHTDRTKYRTAYSRAKSCNRSGSNTRGAARYYQEALSIIIKALIKPRYFTPYFVRDNVSVMSPLFVAYAGSNVSQSLLINNNTYQLTKKNLKILQKSLNSQDTKTISNVSNGEVEANGCENSNHSFSFSSKQMIQPLKKQQTIDSIIAPSDDDLNALSHINSILLDPNSDSPVSDITTIIKYNNPTALIKVKSLEQPTSNIANNSPHLKHKSLCSFHTDTIDQTNDDTSTAPSTTPSVIEDDTAIAMEALLKADSEFSESEETSVIINHAGDMNNNADITPTAINHEMIEIYEIEKQIVEEEIKKLNNVILQHEDDPLNKLFAQAAAEAKEIKEIKEERLSTITQDIQNLKDRVIHGYNIQESIALFDHASATTINDDMAPPDLASSSTSFGSNIAINITLPNNYQAPYRNEEKINSNASSTSSSNGQKTESLLGIFTFLSHDNSSTASNTSIMSSYGNVSPYENDNKEALPPTPLITSSPASGRTSETILYWDDSFNNLNIEEYLNFIDQDETKDGDKSGNILFGETSNKQILQLNQQIFINSNSVSIPNIGEFDNLLATMLTTTSSNESTVIINQNILETKNYIAQRIHELKIKYEIESEMDIESNANMIILLEKIKTEVDGRITHLQNVITFCEDIPKMTDATMEATESLSNLQLDKDEITRFITQLSQKSLDILINLNNTSTTENEFDSSSSTNFIQNSALEQKTYQPMLHPNQSLYPLPSTPLLNLSEINDFFENNASLNSTPILSRESIDGHSFDEPNNNYYPASTLPWTQENINLFSVAKKTLLPPTLSSTASESNNDNANTTIVKHYSTNETLKIYCAADSSHNIILSKKNIKNVPSTPSSPPHLYNHKSYISNTSLSIQSKIAAYEKNSNIDLLDSGNTIYPSKKKKKSTKTFTSFKKSLPKHLSQKSIDIVRLSIWGAKNQKLFRDKRTILVTKRNNFLASYSTRFKSNIKKSTISKNVRKGILSKYKMDCNILKLMPLKTPIEYMAVLNKMKEINNFIVDKRPTFQLKNQDWFNNMDLYS